jgi:hypothetical protein
MLLQGHKDHVLQSYKDQPHRLIYVSRHQCQQEQDGFHPRHQREDFLKVDPLPWDEAHGDESCLVPGNGVVLVALDLEDPFESNRPTLDR